MNYKCLECGWSGAENELLCDSTDACSGVEQVDVCPNCGSQHVIIVFSETGN
ncbi:MAG TPA: hypothetical protein PKV50_00940 [Prolixibacteraceae bacterium]|nr:hypothetical protein [Bacteroidales bacterium]HUM88065.1 hypothetical protein [Prolixibacteraceae bacterium]